MEIETEKTAVIKKIKPWVVSNGGRVLMKSLKKRHSPVFTAISVYYNLPQFLSGRPPNRY